MVVEISDYLSRVEAAQYTIFTQKFHASVRKTLSKFNGDIHKSDNNNYWVLFNSVNDAIQCALEIQHKFKYVTPKHQSFKRRLQLALTSFANVSNDNFTATVHLCEMTEAQVVITSAVKSLYERKNTNAEIDNRLIQTLKPDEEVFLLALNDYMLGNWQSQLLRVNLLAKDLGLSYAQLYRKLLKLSGKTPLTFINDYKLHKALDLLHQYQWSITEIANKTGFNSLSYFSECFLAKYGVRPSTYLKQHN